MTALKAINLGVAFLLELFMLAALAYWGFKTGSGLFLQFVLGIGAPVIALVIWARFMAPRSVTRLKGAQYFGVKALLYGVAAILLASAGQLRPAIIFVVVVLINEVLIAVWKQ